MKQEDKRYEMWLTEIRSKQPILNNQEELTNSILHRISVNTTSKKRKKFLIGAWASGVAATLLLLLFINDTCFAPAPQPMERPDIYDNRSNSISFALPDNWKKMELQEKNLFLSSQYTQHRLLRKVQISQFIKDNQVK